MADSPLVSTEWLHEHLNDPQVQVLDCRWYLQPFDPRDGAAEYAAGHIPGARHVAWDRELADPDRGALNMLAGPERYAAAMEALGVGDDTFVVTYDDHHVPVAARVWWSLRVYGHERAAVLDGGITRWTAEGRPVATGAPSPVERSGTFTPRFHSERYATKADVLAALADPDACVIDARMDVSYAAATGHIPGSARVTGLGFLADGERWMAREEARARIENAGVAGAKRTILTCNGGVAATGAYLGWMLAGLDTELSVYDGSWLEWDHDPDTPKVRH
jgi:thiosulfate/3-mercaptopyruvate sulfurtransferase